MRLEPGDIFSLTNVLNDGYANIADFGIVLASAGRSIDACSSAGELNRTRIFKSVETASREGWIASLLAGVEQDHVAGRPRFRAGHPLLKEAARLRDLLDARAEEIELAAGGNPENALVVFSRPFINRSTFRVDLSHFANAGNSKVFAITGPRFSGRSHYWYLIRHYGETKSKAHLALVDLSERNVDACGPRKLMELLAGQMGLDVTSMPADSLAQDARICEKLTTWLIGQSRAFAKKGENWWIGFDGLDKPQTGQGAIDLMSDLAVAIENGLLKHTRLFLIGLNRPLPPAIDRFVFREQVTGLNRSELRSYLSALVAARGGTIEDAALTRLVNFAFKELPDPLQPQNMRIFGDRVSEIVKLL